MHQDRNLALTKIIFWWKLCRWIRAHASGILIHIFKKNIFLHEIAFSKQELRQELSLATKFESPPSVLHAVS